MTVAHILGIPVEETLLQIVPVGATVVTAVAIAGRTRLRRLGRAVAQRGFRPKGAE